MPSDTPEVLEKLKLIGRVVRINNGHRATVLLTDYRESSNDYDGLLIRNYSMNSDSVNPAMDDKLPHFESVHGLTLYPNEQRPTKIMQFVFPGEDEEPLRLINDGNLPPGYYEMVERRRQQFGPGATMPKDEPRAEQPVKEPPQDATTAPLEGDTDGDGKLSRKEQKRLDKKG